MLKANISQDVNHLQEAILLGLKVQAVQGRYRQYIQGGMAPPGR